MWLFLNIKIKYAKGATLMTIIYRQIEEKDIDSVNDLYEKLLTDHGNNVGLGHRLFL